MNTGEKKSFRDSHLAQYFPLILRAFPLNLREFHPESS